MLQYRCLVSSVLLAGLICPVTLHSQAQPGAEARDQLEAFKTELADTRAELAEARREIQQLTARVRALEKPDSFTPLKPVQSQDTDNHNPYQSPADLAVENKDKAASLAR